MKQFVRFFSCLLFLKGEHLTRHFPSSQVEHQALKAFDDAAALHCRCAAAHVLGGIWSIKSWRCKSPVSFGLQWSLPVNGDFHDMCCRSYLRKKLQILVQTNVDMVSNMYLCNSHSCVFLQEWWKEIVWNTPHPCVTWVGVLSKYHNGPRPWLCNGMLGALHVQGCLASGLDKLLNTAWILCIPWPHCRVGDLQAGIQPQRSRCNA